ncbi:glycosyltransferase family 2 protein [Desulfotruncus alcoholivorax]|uniref:glycosyltransferase family 2 protein n=1 Tax=Desulfotruncus alcoholivorax TaxID=265477 RepID=UPI00042515AE|nr:glycosyltransferase family 2 protein [Desulfotruncus alcoholivorax]
MISIVAPAYNEEPVIEKFVRTVMETLQGVFSFEVLIVNDGSTDKTGEILTRLQDEYNNLVVISHNVNRGLGAGLNTGFKHAKGEIIVTLDADLSQPPSLIPVMIIEVSRGADVVIASRYVKGGSMQGVPWWRVLVSKLGNWLIKMSTGVKARDCTSGMRAYRKEVLKELTDIGTGFEVQLMILKQLHRAKITEVPLNLVNRAAGKSKMQYLRLVPRYLALMASGK